MKTVALGELVDFYSGGTPSKAKAGFWQGDVPWFSAKDMKKPRLTDSIDHVSNEVFRLTSLRKLPAGTIAMVVRGMILAHTVPISVLDVDAAINQDLKALLPKREVDISFLAAMLRAQHATILSQVSTAAHGTKKLESRVLHELRIPYPPLAEQRRIAAILDRADSLRAKRGQVRFHVDSLTQAIFHDMFGDRTDPERTLSEVCSKISDGTHHSPKTLTQGVPYVTAKHLKPTGLDFFSDPWFVSEADHAAIYARCDPRPGDVLYIKDGATTGIADVNPYPFEFSMLSSLALLRPNADHLDGLYLATWLNSPGTKQRMIGAMAGAGITRLTLAKIKSARVPVPPLDLQKAFAQRVEMARAVHSTASGRELDALFASLQSRALRGEL